MRSRAAFSESAVIAACGAMVSNSMLLGSACFLASTSRKGCGFAARNCDSVCRAASTATVE
jgi:hypothetical protein